jgi:hypothetical protein
VEMTITCIMDCSIEPRFGNAKPRIELSGAPHGFYPLLSKSIFK